MSDTSKTVVDVITVEWLEDQHACTTQVDLFRKVFGERAEFTRANLDKAVEVGLDLEWLASWLLTRSARQQLKEALQSDLTAYREALQKADQTRWQTEEPARLRYDAIREQACAAYDRAEQASVRMHEQDRQQARQMADVVGRHAALCQADAAHDRRMASGCDEYLASVRPANKEFVRAVWPARQEYAQTLQQLRREFVRAHAQALAAILDLR